MTYFLLTYGFLSLSHLFVQLVFSSLYRTGRSRPKDEYADLFTPTVAVVMTVYNEDPVLMYRSARSVLSQRYGSGRLQLFIIDDGSKNIEALNEYYDELSENGVVVIRQRNAGKRQAQYNTVKRINEQYSLLDPAILVTIDSDTILQPEAILRLVQPFKDKNVGATTGNVMALNYHDNFLTHLINYRYWLAFNLERAAQSLFNNIACCSGPLSAYRWGLFNKVSKEYIGQRFLGKTCTYGDDRHLTNLVLRERLNTVYVSDAEADTAVPTTIRQYVKQQLRWNKSFYRELLWTPWSVGGQGIKGSRAYLYYDMVMQLILPLMFLIAIGHLIISAGHEPLMLIDFVFITYVVTSIRVLYGLWCTGDSGFIRFFAYTLIHLFILVPTRIYALLTMRDRRWGTR